MVDSVVARWLGDDYQARIFWLNALSLLDPTSSVVEVSFEANYPKGFDDVVVKYDPPVPRSGPTRVTADYHQVKWHVDYGGRFGFEDLTDPDFIKVKQDSLLERLRRARQTGGPSAGFTFITIARIKDGDPLGSLIDGNDKSLRVDKLFDGTTDESRMGKVRKLWREHLQLPSDDELREVVTGLRIFEGYSSLEELRSAVNRRAQEVGLVTYSDANMDFRYDALAKQMKVHQDNVLTRQKLEAFCRLEGLFAHQPVRPDPFLPIAIRSFLGPATDIVGATPENTLLLTADFRDRYLRDDLQWQSHIRPKVEQFLSASVKKSARLRLILDAHTSIAFLTGSVLHLKSGVDVELVQKGQVGPRNWRADDGSVASGERFQIRKPHGVGTGADIAVAVSISRTTKAQTRAYVAAHLPGVGRIVCFDLPTGSGQRSVTGGEHAAVLAEQVANTIRAMKATNPDAMVHIFAAAPNSFLFFLGQQCQGIAPCIVYEFDFDRQGNKSYQPSVVMA